MIGYKVILITFAFSLLSMIAADIYSPLIMMGGYGGGGVSSGSIKPPEHKEPVHNSSVSHPNKQTKGGGHFDERQRAAEASHQRALLNTEGTESVETDVAPDQTPPP